AQRLTAELHRIPLIDPHSHINPHAAASRTLADILGYHYYTELAHSAGLPREQIEEPGISPKEKVARLVPRLAALENTIQYSWLLEMCREFFGFEEPALTMSNWESLYDRAEKSMSHPDWEQQVLRQSGLEGVFLTNDFDDPLTGFDTRFYIPCLRTDDLVFHLAKPDVRARLARATGIEPGTPADLRKALEKLFAHFVDRGARACAISLPPDFEPLPVTAGTVEPVLRAVVGGKAASADELRALSRFVFWTLAELCSEHRLPFDLMIGVNRRVYETGVYQGQDLFDSRCSLIQYRALLNAFPQVVFPISVLAHGMNQELVSYSWIFPNVVTNGHWWYSNTPAYIEPDCRSRLQAVSRTKQIGYYSDMYKLEFALPKFNMYRRVLGKVLAEDFVIGRGWSEGQALRLGREVLRDNVERIFPAPAPR
ncbi:MAG TPA: glucuronate isomerase, partial [Planctomycetaceae bacterium]|nr:glucuronate isomerase [Planctomycetaceae bacterium]